MYKQDDKRTNILNLFAVARWRRKIKTYSQKPTEKGKKFKKKSEKGEKAKGTNERKKYCGKSTTGTSETVTMWNT